MRTIERRRDARDGIPIVYCRVRVVLFWTDPSDRVSDTSHAPSRPSGWEDPDRPHPGDIGPNGALWSRPLEAYLHGASSGYATEALSRRGQESIERR